MDISKDKKNEYISKLEALKQINDLGGKDFNVNNFLTNDYDIFGQMVELSESLLLNDDSDSSNSLNTLKKLTVDSLDKINTKLKDIVLSNIKKSFFVGDGVCGVETEITGAEIFIKPSEIDYLDILKINPESNSGKIIYENDTDKKQKVNLGLYNTFGGDVFNFKTSRNNSSLFDTEWIESDQKYKITLHETNVGTFFEKYYNSISLPIRKDILKNNLLVTLKGENNVLSYNKKVVNINKLLDGIFKNCNDKDPNQENESFSGVKTNFVDDSGLFMFDDMEGFVTDDTDYTSVMKFSTCYEIEVPTKEGIFDEVIYFDNPEEPIDSVIDETIDKISQHTEIMSGFELNLPNIKIGVLKDFILNLPKTFMRTLFTPKIILPIIIMYKKVRNIVDEIRIEDVFIELKKLFIKIIKELFWGFVSELWKKLKGFLTKKLKKLSKKLIKNKSNRYLLIITKLMSVARSIPIESLDNCNSIYDVILKTIDTVVNTRNDIQVPNTMLLLSDQLKGYSQDRAVLNIIETLNNMGISTSPIYGEENNLLKIVDSVVGGNMKELDENGFIKIVLKQAILPSGPGGTIVPPGVVSGVGKLF